MEKLKNNFVKIIFYNNSYVFGFVKDVSYNSIKLETEEDVVSISIFRIKKIYRVSNLLDTMSNKELIECFEFLYSIFNDRLFKEELKNV